MGVTPKIAAIVVAAGSGSRMGGHPKQYRQLAGEAVLSRTIKALLAEPRLDYLLPVIGPGQEAAYAALGLADPRLLPPAIGGASRQASVFNGLQALERLAPDLVLIHDGARPFTRPETIAAVIDALGEHDAALPVIAVTDTIKRSPDGVTSAGTEDRNTLFAAQTPQGFHYQQIFMVHARILDVETPFTDDASIAEWAGLTVHLTPGRSDNIKLTLPEDFARAERLLTGDRPMETRIGSGFDVHPFAPGDAVWLGGVRIPHDRKLKGHSDADVALHALTDAIYGALGEGDIGQHFPPSDPQWKGAASSLFLAHAAGLVSARGGRIVNLDITLVCEAPRIGPHVEAMKAAIAEVCAISPGRVAVKATTNEELGFVGRREGIVAMAGASIELPRED